MHGEAMFKLMYVPKELRHLNYKDLVNRQKDILKEVTEVLSESKEGLKQSNEVKKENDKIQVNLLQCLANLNNCSDEDLRAMQLMTENYMKIAINKEKVGKLNG